MRSDGSERRFRWIGGPTFELRLGGVTILSDPMFGDGPNAFVMSGHPSTGEERATIARAAPLPPIDVAAYDVIVVSHLHSDHFDREAVARLPKGLPVLLPAAQAEKARGWGFTDVRGLEWWASERIEAGDGAIEITALPARHSADDAVNAELGVVNGYLIHHRAPDSSYRAYWTGDTVWFDGIEEIHRRIAPVQLVVPHLGAVGEGGPWGRMTLDAREAGRLLRTFAGARMIPIHHHTFSHYVEPVSALRDPLARDGLADSLDVLDEGDELALGAPAN